jgi:hypothetical protein
MAYKRIGVQARFHPLAGKRFEEEGNIKISAEKARQALVSIPLRGKGLRKEHLRFSPLSNRREGRVSIPLRGKGLRKYCFEKFAELQKRVFPSPCGEKV